jgi:nucleoside-triphosphatase THEP1
MTTSETSAGSHGAHGSILALVYTESAVADSVLRDVATELADAGLTLAGLVQHNPLRPARTRCDMMLEDLSTGDLLEISEDRGPSARGCILMVDRLLVAIETVRSGLAQHPDLVILNKFGKTESEGRGLRSLIADVVCSGLPLLIAVPFRNLDNWRAFAGGLSNEIVLGTRAEAIDAVYGELSRMLAPMRGCQLPGIDDHRNRANSPEGTLNRDDDI